ncbi:nuclear polyadenylated RNA-binding protein 3 [Arabidopsis lyrata subsp. lyrata]|uniref:nuclear polyadenylated RNA-binding protein 3 n=1 Tax=Arabidopsis lyrata subsp. lyrata TaxID=81972 RepID=UPI000A29BF0F|nr:nuclear polyadenylated RNA-binding protein 3 [Arabidopsis lyrata subsp. lyrata]|eukprot:XP_020873992.1 nuclear polyadenylated RNA-binding protein 3 [Arabidopsis lyrata subsp. lyrata]
MEVPSDAEVANKEEEEEVRNSEDVDGEVEVTNSKEGDGEAEVSNSIDADEEERHLDDERGERGSADEEVERNIDAEGRERGSDEEKEEGTNAANAKVEADLLFSYRWAFLLEREIPCWT